MKSKYTFKQNKDGSVSVYANGAWQCFIHENIKEKLTAMEYAKKYLVEISLD